MAGKDGKKKFAHIALQLVSTFFRGEREVDVDFLQFSWTHFFSALISFDSVQHLFLLCFYTFF